MLAKTILVSSLAAAAFANAVPEVTQAPAVRRQFGELGDDIDDIVSDARTNAEDIISRAKTNIGDLGDKATEVGGDIASKASEFGGGVASKASDIGNDIMGCTDAVKLITEMPTPTGDLRKAILSIAADGDVSGDGCAMTSEIPKSLSDDWEDYQSSAMSWYSDNEDKVSKAVSSCSLDPSLVAQITGCAAPSGSAGADGDDDGDDDSSASRVGGIAAAVAGAAFGAVAILL